MSGEARVTTIHVVVPPNVLLLDVAGPAEVLARAGRASGGRVAFRFNFVAPGAVARSSIGLALGGLSPLPEKIGAGDIVMVAGNVAPPAGGEAAASDEESAIVEWLAGLKGRDQRLLSVCAGAILAGRAGLLDGRLCTTHHDLIGELAETAPRARVVDDRLFVADGPCWTSAGVTSGIDLALYLVGEEAGAAVASAIARDLVVYFRRSPGDPQLSPWLEGRNHLHPAVHRAQDAVARDPAADWSVERLAAVGGASERHFSRLFNAHCGMSVSDYVARMRVAVARQWLESSRLDLEAVAERAGFASSRQLRRVWARFHPEPPSRMRGARPGDGRGKGDRFGSETGLAAVGNGAYGFAYGRQDTLGGD